MLVTYVVTQTCVAGVNIFVATVIDWDLAECVNKKASEEPEGLCPALGD